MRNEANLREELRRDGPIRDRIIEYLGGPPLENASAVYLSRSDLIDDAEKVKPEELTRLLDDECSIARSIWDRRYLLCHLDLDYVNFDDPAASLLNPEHAFDMQETVELKTEEILRGFDLLPLHLISGRGHHFVWKLVQSSPAYVKLTKLGRVSADFEARCAAAHPPCQQSVSLDSARSYSGLGLVMEYLAHLIRLCTAPASPIPVTLTAIAVGSGLREREAAVIDISEYADPLWLRVVRIPFTIYGKPAQLGLIGGGCHAGDVPARAMIPLFELSVKEAISAMTDVSSVLGLARRCTTAIPDGAQGTGRLAAEYRRSSLFQFHNWFYSEEHQPYQRWPETYDRLDLCLLPAPARFILENPNPALLVPVNIEFVTRCLLALGWHPRHIAGLIRSKYERDFGWGSYWFTYDASMRADFYVRIIAGLFCTGNDALVDFDSQSTAKKGLTPSCDTSLEPFRQSLFRRKSDCLLGCEPFNRLV